MKVCILTYRLHSNFGFLMQAYALQQVIKGLGHDPYTVDFRAKPVSLFIKTRSLVKYFVFKYIFRNKTVTNVYWSNKAEQRYIDQHTWNFINDNLQLTPCVFSCKELGRKVGDGKYDFYIVGSDQVWRKDFFPHITTYFFDFLPADSPRASYAASFGVSEPRFPTSMMKECQRLLSKFTAVSVREDDGVRICEKLFNIPATHVLDPTMLLNREEYLKLIVNDKINLEIPVRPFVLIYILDSNKEKDFYVENFIKGKSILPFYIRPKNFKDVGSKGIDSCVYPSISTWLSAFDKASFVITDSFHGSVFSIIFKKQFLVLDNPKRGSSRLKSLLSSFCLEERMVDPFDYSNEYVDIDYSDVDALLLDRKNISIEFLRRIFR